MDIQWPSYDDDDGPEFDDDDPGDFYQFTPNVLDGLHSGSDNLVIKCGIVAQDETDPRRVRFLEQAFQDGQPSSSSSSSKAFPTGLFRSGF